MKLTIYCLSLALAASLYLNHLLSLQVGILQAYLNVLVPH